MDYTVIREFEGKRVKVFTISTSFEGSLKLDIQKQVLVLTPTTDYDKKHWASIVIDQKQVVAIRELKERPPTNDGEDDCCDESKG